MKKLLFLLFTILLTTTSILSQQRNGQRIKMLKTAYLTDALSLTPNEAEKFWPVYNLYTTKIQTLKRSLEGGFLRTTQLAGGVENMTETQAQKLVDNALLSEQQIAENKIKMIHELSNIISAKKIVKLTKAEREFNRRILQEYGKRKWQQRQ